MRYLPITGLWLAGVMLVGAQESWLQKARKLNSRAITKDEIQQFAAE